MLPAYRRFFTEYLIRMWRGINGNHLQNGLEPPVFQFSESTRRLGSWQRETRTISLSWKLLMHASEHEVEAVLKHEMAHQYADEVLRAADHAGETPHGSAFRHACALLGIESYARFGIQKKASPLLDRVRKLLALAESKNIHEAELAMTRAKQLMEKYALAPEPAHQEFHYLYLGQPHKQKGLPTQLLAGLLVRFFQVEIVWIPSETARNRDRVWLMEALGTLENLEVAEYVYDYLQRELDWLWKAHRKRNPRLKGKGPKRDFQVGLLKGLVEKLGSNEPASEPGRALIRLKREKIRAFVTQRHPRLYSGRKASYRLNDTYAAGFQKGKSLEIRKGIKEGGTTKNIGSTRYLGSGSD